MMTESRAIRAVQILLDSCDYLTHEIKVNDKTISWDGEIFVYETNDLKYQTSKLYGKISVQVKGRNKVFNEETGHKENIKIVDLRNYARHGGVIYFVVVNTLTKPLVLYKMLLPSDILEYTEGKEHQKTVRVPMDVFPQEPQEILRILTKFIQNRIHQFSLNRETYLHNKKLFQSGKFKTFNFHPGLTQTRNFLRDLTAEDQYMYFQADGLPAKFSIGRVSDMHLTSELDVAITVGGETFYSKITRIYRKGKIFFRFGYSFSFEFIEPEHGEVGTTTFTYEPKGTLKEQIIDNKFLLAMYSNGYFMMDSFRIDNNMIPDQRMSDLEQEVLMLTRIQDMLKTLGLRKEISLHKMTNKAVNLLFEMASCFHNNTRPSFADPEALVQRILLDDIHLSMLFLANEEGWPYRDFFSVKYALAISESSDESERIPISQYLIVNDYNIFICDNFNMEFILQDITTTEENAVTLEWKNRFLLMLLNGYDQSNQDHLLELSIRVAEHLYQNEQSAINKLNLYQTFKRHRMLDDDEKIEINNILNDDWPEENIHIIQVACFLLLDDGSKAHSILVGLPEDEKEQFLELPISRFLTEPNIKKV